VTIQDFVGTAALIVAGVAGGLLIGPVAAVLLGVLGAGIGFVVVRAGIRWVVAIPVVLGTAAGAVLGWAITHAVCRPEGCPVAEASAAVATAVGAFVGVGLVVALVIRSFDEYREGPGRPTP
jgi:hypothetical protein